MATLTTTRGPEADRQFVKIDDLGIVFGFAIVCKVDGADYYDLQGDHIPEGAMLTAAAEFMAGTRDGKVMHEGDTAGQVVFAMPLTADTAPMFGYEKGAKLPRTGLVIGFKPTDPKVIEAFKSGDYTGFSIGGLRGDDEDVPDDADEASA